MIETTHSRKGEPEDRRGSAADGRHTQAVRHSLAVVEAVAAAREAEMVEMPPLQRSVDMDALDALLESAPRGQDVRVSFMYDGVPVTVDGAGRVEVQASRDGD
jgi:hypothetical protein